ncbi:hypothetical protein [Streptomyces sp. NPDC003077]|uniref:hypothetical protein n=1 Tax=Streptomyces sp. NPDC003077 TaxID=3154443 RepID=UPI0033B1056C
MLDWFARIFGPLLWLLWPPLGRHRSFGTEFRLLTVTEPNAPEFPEPSGSHWAPPYRGEDSPLVRPYFVAYEKQDAARRAQWLAAYGFVAEPGTEVFV